jgi:hypothetical protein
MKTSELTGAALNWAVALAEEGEQLAKGWHPHTVEYRGERVLRAVPYTPSTDWSQGGPIIEREGIGLRGPSIRGNAWAAFIDLSGTSQGSQHRHTGPTPLIAAMRCYVASKLGDDINIPEELI